MGEGKAVGARVRSGQTAAATDSRQAPVSRWRSLGLPWLIGVVVIPLLIAAIGYGELDGSRSASSGALATLGPSGKRGAPKMNLAPLSIVRNANDITLTGDFPDDSAKAILLKTLKGSLPSGVNIVDQIQLNPNIDALDFSHEDRVPDAVLNDILWHAVRGHTPEPAFGAFDPSRPTVAAHDDD